MCSKQLNVNNQNQNKKVLQFVWLATGSLLILSLLIHFNKIQTEALQNISVLSGVITQNSNTPAPTATAKKNFDTLVLDTIGIATNKKTDSISSISFKHFTTPNRITNFSTDSNTIVAEAFIKKMVALRKSKKGKIRIAYLGDSMIEGDLVSQTLRRLLQQYFG